ncbi:MAG: MucR family transcriptional regulator [Sphingomonadales bacterium]|nr:MucR family transcriptional regulator [Sphingomonadales bacterium]
MESKQKDNEELLVLTAEIVSSHVSNNSTTPEELTNLIHDVFTALSSAGNAAGAKKDLVPAVPIKKSITPDFIICLEDGKKLKMLRRHLRSQYDLTPEQYREKWGLPIDYPMVAPNYAKRRQELAKQIGLGRKRTK